MTLEINCDVDDEQMSFDLDSLFDLDGCGKFATSGSSSINLKLAGGDRSLDTKEEYDEHNDTSHDSAIEEQAKKARRENLSVHITEYESPEDMIDVNFDILAATAVQDKNDVLIREVKKWKAKAEEYERSNQRLYQKLSGTYQEQSDIPAELTARLRKTDRENQRLRSEITELKEKFEEVERENLLLCEENVGKSRKLKGANKKVRNAKDVAGKEEEKAKSAVHEKIQRQTTERKMKLERNEALAELQKYKKMSEDLEAELKIERAGYPHLREDGVENDYTTVVVPVEFKIHRGDFRKLAMMLDSNRMKIVDGFKRWYKEWKKPKVEEVKVIGAEYVDDKKEKFKIGIDISDDMNEFSRDSRILETGAEHDGWRSKRGLEAICREAQVKANNSC
jgi:hypothetical protein